MNVQILKGRGVRGVKKLGFWTEYKRPTVNSTSDWRADRQPPQPLLSWAGGPLSQMINHIQITPCTKVPDRARSHIYHTFSRSMIHSFLTLRIRVQRRSTKRSTTIKVRQTGDRRIFVSLFDINWLNINMIATGPRTFIHFLSGGGDGVDPRCLRVKAGLHHYCLRDTNR